MTEADYRADKRMNVSLLVHGLKSMRHLKWEMDHPGEPTPAMKRGTMAHCYLLQPAEFKRRYVQMPSFEMDDANCTKKGKPSTSKATEYYETKVAEFYAENRGSEIILESDRQWCAGIAGGVIADPTAKLLLDSCDWEVPLFGKIEGVEVKGLVDLLDANTLGDVKTTVSVHPRMFGASAAKLHYPFKLSWYRELARQNGYPIDTVYLIAVESKGPFDCGVFEIPTSELDNAFTRVCEVLRSYKLAKKTGEWPGVSGGKVDVLNTPLWAMEESDELVEWKETE